MELLCFALLCLMTIFQIDLNCIKVFPIIIMCLKKSKVVLVKKRNDFYETSRGKNENKETQINEKVKILNDHSMRVPKPWEHTML
jgi:hypothetical protein